MTLFRKNTHLVMISSQFEDMRIICSEVHVNNPYLLSTKCIHKMLLKALIEFEIHELRQYCEISIQHHNFLKYINAPIF